MRIKPGVQLGNLTPQMVLACLVVDSVYRWRGYESTVTSGSDGLHQGRPVKGETLDPHYTGRALDFRTSHVHPPDMEDLVQTLATALGGEFVVLQETDHLHIQYGHVV